MNFTDEELQKLKLLCRLKIDSYQLDLLLNPNHEDKQWLNQQLNLLLPLYEKLNTNK